MTERICELDGIPTLAEAEKIKEKFENWDGCEDAQISGDGPYTVTAECNNQSTRHSCVLSGIPTMTEAEGIKRGYEDWDGCQNVEISGDGPYTVSGECE